VYGVVPPASPGHPVTTTSQGTIFESASRAVVKSAADMLYARAVVVCPDHVVVKVPPPASTVIVCTSATAFTPGTVVAIVTEGAVKAAISYLIVWVRDINLLGYKLYPSPSPIRRGEGLERDYTAWM